MTAIIVFRLVPLVVFLIETEFEFNEELLLLRG